MPQWVRCRRKADAFTRLDPRKLLVCVQKQIYPWQQRVVQFLMTFLEPQAYSNKKPALALLFSDNREERFSKSLNRLEPALKGCGYNVKRFDGSRNIVADFRREQDCWHWR